MKKLLAFVILSCSVSFGDETSIEKYKINPFMLHLKVELELELLDKKAKFTMKYNGALSLQWEAIYDKKNNVYKYEEQGGVFAWFSKKCSFEIKRYAYDDMGGYELRNSGEMPIFLEIINVDIVVCKKFDISNVKLVIDKLAMEYN